MGTFDGNLDKMWINVLKMWKIWGKVKKGLHFIK